MFKTELKFNKLNNNIKIRNDKNNDKWPIINLFNNKKIDNSRNIKFKFLPDINNHIGKRNILSSKRNKFSFNKTNQVKNPNNINYGLNITIIPNSNSTEKKQKNNK